MHRKLIPGVIARSTAPATIGENATAQDAAEKMLADTISALAVLTDAGKISGIVSAQDITHRVVALGKDARQTTVADIMTADPDVLAATDSALDAFTLMVERSYRDLPVLDSDGSVIAVLALDDLVQALRDTISDKLSQDEQAVFGPTST